MRVMDIFEYASPLRLLAVAFIAGACIGYCSHDSIATDPRYRIERRSKKPFLVDKLTHDSVEITNNFQLGGIEYRIEGLLREKNLREVLEELSIRYSYEEGKK